MCMDFSDRVRKAIRDSGLRQVEIADKVGVTPAAVNNWLNRPTIKDIRSDVLFALAKVTGKSPMWLVLGEGGEELNSSTMQMAPFIGTPVPIIDMATADAVCRGDARLPATSARNGRACPVEHGPRTFIVRMNNDTMVSPTGLKSSPPGSYMYVDPDQTTPSHDKPVLARLSTGELVFGHYMAQAGRVWLRFLNPAYQPYNDGFEVVGLVVFKGEDP